MVYVYSSFLIILTLFVQGCAPRDSAMLDRGSPAPRATVFFFIATDCPISNGYAPEIIRICNEYGPCGVSFQAVYPDPDSTPEQVARHRAEYGLPCPAVIDPDHRLTRQAGATVTPEVAVFVPVGVNGESQVVYRGRIDDRHTDLGRSRPTPGVRDLREVLDAVLAGHAPIELVTRPAVGCHIPNAKG